MTHHPGNHSHNHSNRLFDNTAARLLDNASAVKLYLWRDDEDVSLTYELHGEVVVRKADGDGGDGDGAGDDDGGGGLLAADKPDRSADIALLMDLLKRFLT